MNQFSSLDQKNIHDTLINGGLIAFPTESMFGLGCDPGNKKAVEKLKKIKNRPQAMGFILLTPDLVTISQWIDPDKKQTEIVSTPVKRPTTYIVPASNSAPCWLTTNNTLALRINKDPIVQSLSDMLGLPIISTSANRHGEAPCKSASEVQKTMGSLLDYIIEGEKGSFERPSTIIDLCSGKTIRP